MSSYQQKKFDELCKKHLNSLKRQSKSATTIDTYSRAIGRISTYLDRCPDKLTVDQLKDYFDMLLQTHSWSTVKTDLCGLQCFYKHVLDRKTQGKRRIRGGRAPIRTALYMAMLSAIQHNTLIKLSTKNLSLRASIEKSRSLPVCEE